MILDVLKDTTGGIWMEDAAGRQLCPYAPKPIRTNETTEASRVTLLQILSGTD